ncbi:hypothetical protein TNCV_4242801 [Trichonephila clavipes]|nr:hypothetical protein TNCV_4242801 [Trichonephila clavipes]
MHTPGNREMCSEGLKETTFIPIKEVQVKTENLSPEPLSKHLVPELLQAIAAPNSEFENNGSVRNAYRVLRPFYRRINRPSEQLIRLTMERFRTTFTLIDNSHPQRRRTVRTEESIATVERSIEEDQNESIRIEHRNWICVYPLYGRFCGRILVCVLTKSNLCKNYSQTIIKQGVDSSNGPKTRLPLFPIFISEFSLAMKRTSG